jgi:hypothetical protein
MTAQVASLLCPLSEERLRLLADSIAVSDSKPSTQSVWHRELCSSRNSTALPSPALSDDSLSESESLSGSQRTTLIVRQVPREITRQRAVQALEEQGLGNDIDFLYCPLDYISKKGFGYVLLNFTSPRTAVHFRERFQGQPASWLVAGHASPLDIVWAIGESRQGLQANIDRYRNSPVMHSIVPDEFKPIVLSRGRRVAFGRPTEKLEAPSKLPRAVWKAWTAGKKAGSESTHKTEPSVMKPSQAVSHMLVNAVDTAVAATSMDTLAMSAQLYWDHRFKLAFRLPLGFQSPPGLPQPAHLQLL